jgi:purine-nucleoside phosphorylase
MTLAQIAERKPQFGIVLGSGLGAVADRLGVTDGVPYSEIPGLPQAKVQGHLGKLGWVEIEGHGVVVAQGRSHLYEGHSAAGATQMMAVMHGLGVRQVILTNAAGCLNTLFDVGDLMLITDHINLTGTSPLLGGPNFVDMSEVYDWKLRQAARQAADTLGVRLHEGVYAAMLGPQYETPAEIRMLRVLGADAVGMSTALEAIRARSLQMKVMGVSTLTNWAAGMADALDHKEVVAVGQEASERLASLVKAVIRGFKI